MRPAEPEKPTHVMRLVESLLRPAMLARPIKNQKLVSEARARLCSRPAISHLHLLCTFRTCTFCVHSELAHFCAFHLVASIAYPSIDRKKQLPPLLAASCFPVPRKHSPPSLFSRVTTRKHKTKQTHSSIVEAKPHPQPPYQALAWSYRYWCSLGVRGCDDVLARVWCNKPGRFDQMEAPNLLVFM